MPCWKSCLRTTTLLTAVMLLTAGSAHAGSGTITYDMQYISQFGTTGLNNLNFPEQIAVGPDNNIYVANRDDNNILVFDKSGNYLSQFGTGGTGPGEFTNTIGIAFNTDGKIVTSDLFGNRIQFFDPSTYAFISSVGTSGSGQQEFSVPSYVTVDASGNIYIGDTSNHRMEILDSQGNYVGQINSGSYPFSAAIASDGRIYIVDPIDSTVSIYNTSYTLDGYLALSGTANGQVNYPVGISVDSRDNIYVGDQNNRIQIFDKTGNWILSYDNSASTIGQFQQLRGIYADVDGKVYVSELGNNSILTLQLTSTETFVNAPTGNQTAATPLSDIVLQGNDTFGNDFIGYNNVTLNNGAVWTLSGSSSFTGQVRNENGTLINDGTLSSVFGNNYDVITNNGIYNFSAYFQNLTSGVFTNNGTINGANFTNIGTLINNGVLDAAVNNYGTYSGTGSISSNFNNLGGTIDLGNSIAELTIGGNYIDDNAASYIVAVNDAGQSSRITTTGTAPLAGAAVDVQAASGSYTYNTSYVILIAGGGITGTFGTVTSNLAFLTPTLDYSNPNQVTLTLTNSNMASIDFAPFALSSNQQSAGVALTAFSASQFGGNAAVFNTVMGLSQSDASAFLSQISPDEIATLPQIQRSMVSNMQQPLFQRLSAVADTDQSYALYSPFSASAIRPDQVWVQTLGGVSNQDSTSNGAAGYRLGMIGTRIGADKVLDNGSVMGISAAYAHGTADYTNSNDKSETQYGHADLYGRHSIKDTSIILEGFIGAGGGRMDSTRFVSAGGLGLMASGNTNAYDVSASIRASNPIKVTQNDTIIPNLTTNLSWTKQNSFTETGAAPFNLNMSSITATPVTITSMVNWQHIYTNKQQGFNLTPDLGIGATWQLNELSNNVNAHFSNGTNIPGFTVSSAKQSPLSINLSASVTMEPFTENVYVPQLTAQATTQASSKTSNAIATLTAKWNW